jgi:hypothetical protein
MIETPAQHVAVRGQASCPADDLSAFSYHTGTALRPVRADEPCPVLFRDLGLMATARFLRGDLRRLAGPLTPITYLRTHDYVEPYTDHEHIGRLILLRPLALAPWHSGLPHIYVARAIRWPECETLGFVPGDVPLAAAAALCANLRSTSELREALGGRHHDETVRDTLHRLERVAAELEAVEVRAGCLRRAFQAPNRRSRELARAEMHRLGITENDLCAAWHHLPRERRAFLGEVVAELRMNVIDPASYAH